MSSLLFQIVQEEKNAHVFASLNTEGCISSQQPFIANSSCGNNTQQTSHIEQAIQVRLHNVFLMHVFVSCHKLQKIFKQVFSLNLVISSEVISLNSIYLNHFQDTLQHCFVAVCSDIYIKQRQGTFLLTSSSIFSCFLMTHLPSIS